MKHTAGLAATVAVFVGVVVSVPTYAINDLHNETYARFRAATAPDVEYACERVGGQCAGSAPVPGTNWVANYHASSTAEVGLLRAFADVYLTGDGSLGPLTGVNGQEFLSVGGRAGFIDTVTVRGGVGAGRLDFRFSVSGPTSQTSGQSGRGHFQYLPVVNGQRQWDRAVDYYLQQGDSTVVVSVPIVFGAPTPFAIEFYALAQVWNWTSGAAAHADVTALLSEVRVYSDTGAPLPAATVSAESGTRYEATGIVPTFRPPADTPAYACVGLRTCLMTWGDIADAKTGKFLVRFLGLPSFGVDVATGLPNPSAFVAAKPLNQVGNTTPPLWCDFFRVPPPFWPYQDLQFSSLRSWVLHGPPPIWCGDAGALTGSMYGEAAFGSLHLFAGHRAFATPSTIKLTTFAGAAANEIFLIGSPSTTLVFPQAQPGVTGVANDRVAKFIFDIHGSLNESAQDAVGRAGYFVRHSGGPCPSLTCAYPPGPWDGPKGPQLETVEVPFDQRYPFLMGLDLVAGATAKPPDPNGTYDSSAFANLSSTATLVGIKVYEGTLDNRGPEVHNFRIVSASGTQYNAHGAAFAVPVSVLPRHLEASSNGTLKVTIHERPDLRPRAQVDPSSLTFGVYGTEPSLAFCENAERSSSSSSLSCHFYRSATGLSPATPVGVLQGRLYDGRNLQGVVEIRVK